MERTRSSCRIGSTTIDRLTIKPMCCVVVLEWILFCLVLVRAQQPSCTTAYAYTHSILQRRSIQPKTPAKHNYVSGTCFSIETVFQRCLQGWRRDNLGLPWYIPFPLFVQPGNEQNGVGLVVTRAPFALREGIVDVTEEYDDNNGRLVCKEIVYRVLNPGWLTFPVHRHEGRIRMTNLTATSQESSLRVGQSLPNEGILLEWNVHWTPLPLFIFNKQWHDLLESFVIFIISNACDYIAAIGLVVQESEAGVPASARK